MTPGMPLNEVCRVSLPNSILDTAQQYVDDLVRKLRDLFARLRFQPDLAPDQDVRQAVHRRPAGDRHRVALVEAERI